LLTLKADESACRVGDFEDHHFFNAQSSSFQDDNNDITGQCTDTVAFQCVGMDGLLPYVQTFCYP
jgi:hypothetical protein